MRDKNIAIILPLISISRTSIDQSSGMGATLGTGGKEAILDFTEINPFGEPTETK